MQRRYFQETICHLTFSDYQIIENAENLKNIEGYEWRTVHATIVFADDKNTGCSSIVTDYNDIKILDGIDPYTDEPLFTVKYNGTEYTRCTFSRNYGWSDTITWEVDFYFRVPIGYDGAVVGFFDKYNGKDGRYIYDYADENTLFFRFD